MGVSRVFQPLVEAALVYKLDGARAFTRMKQEIIWLGFQAAYSTNNVLCIALALLRLHAVGDTVHPGCTELRPTTCTGYAILDYQRISHVEHCISGALSVPASIVDY